MAHGRKIAVIGLGYVGLPVAVAFARTGVPLVGFDIDAARIAELRDGRDRTCQVKTDDLTHPALKLTSDPISLKGADFFIVTVPTPITEEHQPDLSMVLEASRIIGSAMSKDAVVVYESTVYPGATEEECVPLLETCSGLANGRDFFVGYSPERINPGDEKHRFETILKVVSGQDERTLDLIAEVYGSVVTGGIYRAPSIKVAEAAKAIENAQRDINVAFMNELSEIFHAIGIDTMDVLTAARTKWNFLPFTPGLVGGHCIGVDPYYLTYRAARAGYQPEVILSGRRINDSVGERVARECIRQLLRRGDPPDIVTVLGLSFKENVPDIRNSKVFNIVHELRSFGVTVQVHDPIASVEEAAREYGIELLTDGDLKPGAAVILAVAHDSYVAAGWPLVQSLLKNGSGVVMDIKAKLDRGETPKGIDLWRM
jgi:UDP-N-acetyl-D-glucosamine/UDP-N-acetyl-D-galactosamine dehydrogenase